MVQLVIDDLAADPVNEAFIAHWDISNDWVDKHICLCLLLDILFNWITMSVSEMSLFS